MLFIPPVALLFPRGTSTDYIEVAFLNRSSGSVVSEEQKSQVVGLWWSQFGELVNVIRR